MKNFIYKFTRNLLKSVYKLVGPELEIKGEEYIQSLPTVFVSNHFTNIETLLIPYIISEQKVNKGMVRSLAKEELFTESSSKYLNSIGVFSTKKENRNNFIIGDLITGSHHWIIYPEGMMVKNKQVVNAKNKLFLESPYYNGRPKTGAAVLALRAYLKSFYMREKKEDNDYLEAAKKEFLIENLDHITEDVAIQPITITFYPLYAQENIVAKAIELFSDVDVRSKDELMSESSFLLKGNTLIYFHPPIFVKEFIKATFEKIKWILPESSTSAIITELYRWPLTQHAMRMIYSKLFINVDHLLVFYLANVKNKQINLSRLKDFIVLASLIVIEKKVKYNYHPHLEQAYQIYTKKGWKAFDKIFDYCLKEGLLSIKDGLYEVDASFFSRSENFQQIRINNPFVVIYNEFLPLYELGEELENFIERERFETALSAQIRKMQLEQFYEEHRLFENVHSKPIQVGLPRFHVKSLKTAVLMCHGYLASPMELDDLAKDLRGDYSLYQMRLSGHGTNHENLKKVSYNDWLKDYILCLIALRKTYERVVALGFSTGATLMINAYFKTTGLIDGLIALSPALEIVDKMAQFIPGIILWNEISQKLRLNSWEYDKIVNNARYPITNYQYNHVQSVDQLNKLLSETLKLFGTVYVPSLIIQSRNDTVVKSSGSEFLLKRVSESVDRELYMIDGGEHVIVKGQTLPFVSDKVQRFLKSHWAS